MSRYWVGDRDRDRAGIDNDMRAERAQQALDAYAPGERGYEDDEDAKITDLMSDLLHLQASLGLLKKETDLDQILSRIRFHFEEER